MVEESKDIATTSPDEQQALVATESTSQEQKVKVAASPSNPFEANLRQLYSHVNVDQLKRATQILPSNYDYEIMKTVLKVLKAKHDFLAKNKDSKPYSYKISL